MSAGPRLRCRSLQVWPSMLAVSSDWDRGSGSSRGGLESREARPADLVFTDIFLHDEDALAKMLNLVRRHPEMKVIVVSGAANQDIAIRMAKLLGRTGSLRSPFVFMSCRKKCAPSWLPVPR